MRILVIEDEARIQSFLARGLEAEGYTVVAAGDGREGLDLAKGARWDLVVLDLLLPGLNGLQVLQELNRAKPELPVVILSARGDVQTKPKIYLVLWGSQWSSDPSTEATLLQSFLGKVFGSSWLNSVTQYCQGIAYGSSTCGSTGHAGNGNGSFAGTYPDNGSAAPSSPSQNQLAAEAIKAAAHFGNTASGSNNTTQYVIATSHGNNASGFGTSYCAWHSSSNEPYINLPYLLDAGTACGENFINTGVRFNFTRQGNFNIETSRGKDR